jgi:hypothetical protein
VAGREPGVTLEEGVRVLPNNSMQRTALRAAADAERETDVCGKRGG